MKESAVEKKLLAGARKYGWHPMKFVSPGNSGVPDRILIGPSGRTILAELKTEDGRLSPMQRVQIKRLRRLGHDVRVIYGPKGVNAFLEELKEIKLCEYCHEDADGYVLPLEKNCHAFISYDMDGWTLNLKAKGWRGHYKIKFCPMCGRKLEAAGYEGD